MRRLFLVLLLVVLGVLTGSAFRFEVPAEAIRASVIQDPSLVERAWRLPVASSFSRTLAWQSNGSRCGPASVANVYRSLGEKARSENEVLADTGKCRTGYCILGLNLDELAEVAQRHTGRKVTVLRNLTSEQFREHMRDANRPDRRYIINFDRKSLFGSGFGHFSPVGGYLESEDLVFVLDTNRRFQPWLVERARLFSAMDTFDGERKRGLLLIE